MFEIDNIQFMVKGPSAEHQLPWRFEIIYKSRLNSKIENWISDINEDFGGKLNEDPPREFYQIIADKFEEIGGLGSQDGDGEDEGMFGDGDDDDDWDAADAYGEEEETKDQIVLNELGTKGTYLKQPEGISSKIREFGL